METIDNYVNKLCGIMNKIGKEYDFRMDKSDYLCARTDIKHTIQNAGSLILEKDYPDFEKYCRTIFDKYIPTGVV